MSDIAIDLKGIVKDYRIGEYHAGGIVNIAANVLRNRRPIIPRPQAHRALNGIDLTIRQGEVVGLIGHNGSGKSTLLKILARITDPTEGHGRIEGRVAPLLEVGTGFNPELTGRENVFVNGALLGMTVKEIKEEFENIVEFAGVGKYIDTPIKRYSSGMKVRLGFAVAAHLKPEIMLVDEVLAVGDAAFQRKSTEKLTEVNKSGRTIIFVSHQLELIKKVCNRAIRLDQGSLVDDGPVDAVLSSYFSSLMGSNLEAENLLDRPRSIGSGTLRFDSASISTKGAGPDERNIVMAGKPAVLSVAWKKKSQEPINYANIEAWVMDVENRKLAVLSTRHMLQTMRSIDEDGQAVCEIDDINLVPGRYKIRLVAKENNTGWADCVEDALVFEVIPGDFYGTGQSTHGNALMQFRHSWLLGNQPDAEGMG